MWAESAVRWTVPIVEESVKTGLALFFDAFIPLVHLVFGLVEALYDLMRQNKAGRWGAVMSIIGHSLFGSLTYLVYFYSNNIYLGSAVGTVVHISWNLFAMSSSHRRI